MDHVVRRVIDAEGKKTLGYGVFRAFQVERVPEQGPVDIKDCADLEDKRPLREQQKRHRLLDLCKTLGEASLKARQLSKEWQYVER